MALKRMDNVGIVVDDLAATIDFFRELGLELEGRATSEGEWAGRVTGLGDQRVEIAMMRTPDGQRASVVASFRVAGLTTTSTFSIPASARTAVSMASARFAVGLSMSSTRTRPSAPSAGYTRTPPRARRRASPFA